MLVCCDSGKHSLKIVTEQMSEVLVIRNKMHEGFQELIGKGSYNVVHDNKRYVVGKVGAKNDATEGKASHHHLITTLCAIALVSGNKKDDIQLMYSESASRHKKNKEDIVKLFKGIHEIEVNGVKHTITINSVMVIPEAIGYILQNLSDFQRIVYILDIGGLTSQFLVVNSGSPTKMLGSKMGMNEIVNKIYTRLNELGYDFYTREQIEQDIDNGAKLDEVSNVINEIIREQLESIHEEMLQHGINLHNIPELLCVGGTCLRLEKEIKETYKNAVIVEDAQLAHVKGMLKYGLAIQKAKKVAK